MAQRVILVDDLDGTDAEETVVFGIDGKAYEIDLNSDHAKDLRNRLTGFTDKAREVRKYPMKEAPASKPSVQASAGNTYQQAQERKAYLTKVRRWAKRQGIEVGEKGRVPQEVLDQYDAAH